MSQFKWLQPSQLNYVNLANEYLLTPSGYCDPIVTDAASGYY